MGELLADMESPAGQMRQRRSRLGEQVYPLVEKLAGSEAGLVTGMILTLDITIVEEAVEEPEVLSRLVSSALSRIEVCRRSKAKEKENSAGSDCGSSQSHSLGIMSWDHFLIPLL